APRAGGIRARARGGRREAPGAPRPSDADARDGAVSHLVRAHQRAVLVARGPRVASGPGALARRGRQAQFRGVASGTSWTTPALDVSVDRAGDVLAQPIEPGAFAPVATTDATRDGEVALEQRGQRIGEAGVGDLLVGLEVPAQAPAIEVARADRHPVIAQDRLRVQHL